MCVEDGATLAECLSRAQTAEQIPKAMRVYESSRKPRAEKLKNASEESGVENHLQDGEEQRKRDENMKMIMKRHLAKIPGKGEKNEHPTAWIMGYDVVGHVSVPFLFLNVG